MLGYKHNKNGLGNKNLVKELRKDPWSPNRKGSFSLYHMNFRLTITHLC